MKSLKINDINKLYSPTWIACNDNSKSKDFRKKFIEEFGGEFIKSGKYHKWQVIPPPEPIYVPRRLLKFIDSTGKLIEIDHMSDYCKENKLAKAAMYEVLSGIRKQYKGYTAPPKPEDPLPDPNIIES